MFGSPPPGGLPGPGVVQLETLFSDLRRGKKKLHYSARRRVLTIAESVCRVYFASGQGQGSSAEEGNANACSSFLLDPKILNQKDEDVLLLADADVKKRSLDDTASLKDLRFETDTTRIAESEMTGDSDSCTDVQSYVRSELAATSPCARAFA